MSYLLYQSDIYSSDFDALDKFDVISLDVFDTAITRIVDAPVDVFAIVETRLAPIIGSEAEGFAQLREEAERRAREVFSNQEDVTLEQIYEAYAHLKPAHRAYIARMIEEEIAAELVVLQPVPAIAELVRRARVEDKRVVFVSDMYHSSDVIRRFLDACGYGADVDLLVSSETNCTKARGTQWAVLRQHVGPDVRILHIGDDAWSDVGSPRDHGLEARQFINAVSERRPGAPLTPAILPFSRLARARALDTLDDERIKAPDNAAMMARIGASWGCVVVGAYVRWLERKATEQKVDHLWFCARDGWLPYRVWRESGASERTGVSASYLYASRRSVNLAEVASEAKTGLSQRSLERLVTEGSSLKTILQRARLDGIEALSQQAAAIVIDGTRPINGEEARKLQAIFKIHEKDICAALAPMLKAASGYLAQEAPDVKRIAMVDMGWNGTLQVSMKKILQQVRPDVRLSGFYMGLWPKAQTMRPLAGWMEGFLTSDFRTVEERRGLHAGVALLENLFLADDGSTLGYERRDGRWHPVLQESPVEARQHATLITPFQNAAAAKATQLLRGESTHGVTAADLTPAAALAAVDRLVLSPSSLEMKTLGAIEHSREFDHTSFLPLIPPPVSGKEAPWPWSTDWPSGTALAWRHLALQHPLGDPWREATLVRMRTFNNDLDVRSARLHG